MARKLSRAMGVIILGSLLLLPMVTPAAATVETFNIIFTPNQGPAPSGSLTVNVTCSSCTLFTGSVVTFDFRDTPAEWTPPDPSFFTLTINGSGLVTSLDSSGILDSLPPGHPTVHDLFLGFGPGNAYHIAGSDSTINPPPIPPGANGTYELVQVATVPEPVVSGLLLAGLAGCGVLARRRRRRRSG